MAWNDRWSPQEVRRFVLAYLLDGLLANGLGLEMNVSEVHRNRRRGTYETRAVIRPLSMRASWSLDDEVRFQAWVENSCGLAKLVGRAEDGCPIVKIKLVAMERRHAKAK